MKSHPVGHGNHENVHYVISSDVFKFKLCGFPNTEKIYIMSSSVKMPKKYFNTDLLCADIKQNLLDEWGLNLIADGSNLFDLRFDKTKDLLQSDYYIKS